MLADLGGRLPFCFHTVECHVPLRRGHTLVSSSMISPGDQYVDNCSIEEGGVQT